MNQLSYERPALIEYGHLAALTGTVNCSASGFTKAGTTPDELTPFLQNIVGDPNDATGAITCK